MRPLEGMRVVALEHAVAAPLCSRHLADLGADVIKIERPGSGDFARDYDNYVNGICSHFIWLNRGKRSVTLDVKSDSGRAILTAVARRCRRPVAKPRPRRRGPIRLCLRSTQTDASETRGLRYLRLWRVGADGAEESLRPPDPGGVWPDQRHRLARGTVAGRDIHRRHRHRNVRTDRHHGGACCAEPAPAKAPTSKSP